MFGGVLEVFVWYFVRFSGGKHKGNIKKQKRINNITPVATRPQTKVF